MSVEQEYDAELLESNNDDTQESLDADSQTPGTPVNDMSNCMGMPPQQQQHQQGLYSNVRRFDFSLDSMFAADPNSAGLTHGIVRQYNIPFAFR